MQATRLIAVARPPERSPGGGAAAALTAAALLGFMALATLSGADQARRPLEPRAAADEVMKLALVRGSDDPAVRERLSELRSTLGRRPLDSMTRAAYSSLLLSLSRGPDDIAAAVFHARRAVELAPVTLPVVRAALLVFAYSGRAELAAGLVRAVFDYDAETAASWLARIEPLLGRVPVDSALPDDPDAWLAWSVRLDLAGRHDESQSWLARGTRRFPDDLGLLERATVRALHDRDWQRLAELLPFERRLPDERAAAAILVNRAMLHAHRQDPANAIRDVERALGLAGENPNLRIAAGEAYLAAGDPAAARRMWGRLAFDLDTSQVELRRRVLEHLARLEDEQGSPAAALRAWRAVAEVEPEHAQARRRIDDLTGFHRGLTE